MVYRKTVVSVKKCSIFYKLKFNYCNLFRFFFSCITNSTTPIMTKRLLLSALLGLLAVSATFVPSFATIRYVNAGVIGGTGDGLSWPNAYLTLQTALSAAVDGDQIWVAKGTYYPDEGGSFADNDRYAAFSLKNGVAVYGGFAGNEPANYNLSQRNFTANETILSGDIDKNDAPDFVNRAGNSYHIIYNDELDETALLDGFTIKGGNADKEDTFPHYAGAGLFNRIANPSVTNCVITDNTALQGAGMMNYASSSPTITHCSFIGNKASGGGAVGNFTNSNPMFIGCIFQKNEASSGGGMYNQLSDPKLTNCTFWANKAVLGGVIYDETGTLLLTHCTFAGNTASQWGSCLDISYSTVTFNNCIVWNNGGIPFFNDGGTITVNHCLLEPGTNSYTVAANTPDPIVDDPLFRNAAAGDLRLTVCSPAVNTGSNVLIPAGITTDLDGNPRIYNNATVDLGAYELQSMTTVSSTNATCSVNGSITLGGVLNNTTYYVEFLKDNTNVKFGYFESDGNGQLLLSEMGAGVYTNIKAYYGACVSTPVSATITESGLPKPSITLTARPEMCEGSTSFKINYNNPTESPVTYSVSGPGIVTVTDTPLPPSPITVQLNSPATGEDIPFLLTVKNAVGCISPGIRSRVGKPEMEIKAPQPTCTADGQITVISKENNPFTVSYSIGGTGFGVGGSTIVTTAAANPVTITIPKGPRPHTVYYLRVNGYAEGCNSGILATHFESVTGCCPTIPQLNLPVACAGTPFSLSASGLTSMASVWNSEQDFGIQFVYFNAPTATPYSGGTLLGTVPFAGLTDGAATAVLNGVNLPAGTYYIYARLSSVPAKANCLPSMMGTLTVKPSPSSALSASKTDVCPNTEVTLSPNCSIPTATVQWNPGAPTVTPNAPDLAYTYKVSCTFDGCTGSESSIDVRTHRILVDLKTVGVGVQPKALAGTVKDNLAPTNTINMPTSPRLWTIVANGCSASESAVFKLTGPVNFSSIDNNPPYAIFANVGADYFAIDHPNYGNGTSGFPNGTYNLTVDLRGADGVGGPFPKNRVATGPLLATRTLQFTIGSATREGANEQAAALTSELKEESWLSVGQNPVSTEVVVRLSGKPGQSVELSLTNLQGQTIQQRNVVLTSMQQYEVLNVAQAASGMYVLKGLKDNQAKTLKVVKMP
jgi:hypothetical protein